MHPELFQTLHNALSMCLAGSARHQHEAWSKQCTQKHKGAVQGAGCEPALEDCTEDGALLSLL